MQLMRENTNFIPKHLSDETTLVKQQRNTEFTIQNFI